MKMLRLSFLRGKAWKYLAAIILPLVFLPVPLLGGTSESRCGYVILLMAAYWTLEPIPLAATSLLPIVLFPLLGVLSTAEACTPYMNSTNMMFIGGLMMAAAIEDCNLHKRIALNVLLRIQPTASRMMLGFMMTAMFLSMWISNTATAALMVPIIDAVLIELESKSFQSENCTQLKTISVISNPSLKASLENESIECIQDSNLKSVDPPSAPFPIPKTANWSKKSKQPNNAEILRKAMLLSVAYSTNVGGTGTITGTGPNLVVKGIVEDMFPESNDLSFDKWMIYNIPVMLICVFVAWSYLHLVYVRKSAPKYTNEMKQNFKEIIRKKHEELGEMSFQEKCIVVLFVLLVMLWIFRDPHFITGWGKYFPMKVRDATPAIGVPLLLFLIPSEPWNLSRSPPLMEWRSLQAKLPWGIIILLGGGFSLAEGSKQSGLSIWASRQLASLNISSPMLVVAVLCLLTATLTEVTSNVATANVLLPVVAQLVKPGLFMNIICVIIEVIMINTLGLAVFDFQHLPDWANKTLSALNATGS